MLRNVVEQREIAHLCHFTRVENLTSILTNGIIPRSRLEQQGVEFVHNDEYRFDECKNASCFTISFPNYKMFYPLRMRDTSKDWAVLRISPNVLFEKECAFCKNNAASNTVTSIPLIQRKSPQAFKALFEDSPGMPTRATTGVYKNLTTNPQAEVLIFDVVETTAIVDVNFRGIISNVDLLKRILKNFPNFKYWQNDQLFSYRHDYAHW